MAIKAVIAKAQRLKYYFSSYPSFCLSFPSKIEDLMHDKIEDIAKAMNNAANMEASEDQEWGNGSYVMYIVVLDVGSCHFSLISSHLK